MDYKKLEEAFNTHKEHALQGRYITPQSITPLLEKLAPIFKVSAIGKSVQERTIYQVRIGTGPIKVLGWSQMHGNESTTTKALFDLFNWIALNKESNTVNMLFESITLVLIPMLNPDGSAAYTRVNANQVDLNRDAQNRSQPESEVLHKVYSTFKPDYCLNLHGQRTIFGVGEPSKSAIVSFLSPAQDELRTVTQSRKTGMAIISRLAAMLQEFIPDHIGRYDDGFNINCVGDTLQQLNIPTILFEAGHFPGDYEREETRKLIFLALLCSMESIALSKSEKLGSSNPYFSIPENKKCFFDIIIRAAVVPGKGVVDVAVQYEERLIDDAIRFIPKIAKIADLETYKGHREIDFKEITSVFSSDFEWKEGQIIDNLHTNSK